MRPRKANSVGVLEAKVHFAALLTRVSNGEVIEITRRGVPVARLTPIYGRRKERTQGIKGMLNFHAGRKLGRKLSLKKLIEAGRRF